MFTTTWKKILRREITYRYTLKKNYFIYYNKATCLFHSTSSNDDDNNNNKSTDFSIVNKLPTFFHHYTPSNVSQNTTNNRIITILGGIHGNELVGVEIIKWLQGILSSSPPSLFHNMTGELMIGLGNPNAINLNKRATSNQEDLNRCFTTVSEETTKNELNNLSYEKQRALEIRPILNATSILIDIHATNKPSPPFIRIAGNKFTEDHKRVINYFSNSNIILRDINYTIGNGLISTTDEFVGNNNKNGIGICYEVGQASDMSCMNNVKKEIKLFLEKEMNLILPEINVDKEDDNHSSNKTTTTIIYEMMHAINLPNGHRFEWANNINDDNVNIGDENFEFVPANQDIGYMYNLTTNEQTKIISYPFDCYLVFPKVEELMVEGKPVVWVAKES